MSASEKRGCSSAVKNMGYDDTSKNTLEKGDQGTPFCSLEIINQYGQFVGEFSRLDDELWFSKGEVDDVEALAEPNTNDGLECALLPSYNCNIDLEQLPNYIGHSVSHGGLARIVNEDSPSDDSSLNLCHSTSPVSVLPRGSRTDRRKHLQPKDGNLFDVDISVVTTFSATAQTEPFQSEDDIESLTFDEMDEIFPGRPIKTKKLSDLLQPCLGERAQNLTVPRQTVKAVKKCTHCETTETPQWREGPMGRKTLCNACGVQYRFGRLLPIYRPLKSPTFDPSLHTCLSKKVQEMKKSGNTEVQQSFNEKSKQVLGMRPPINASEIEQNANAEFLHVRERIIRDNSRRQLVQERRKRTRSTWLSDFAESDEEYNPQSVGKRRMRHNTQSKQVQESRKRACTSSDEDKDCDYNAKSVDEAKQRSEAHKRCLHCGSTKTPQWREGPMGRGTLCNACGVRYRKGRLFSDEYRPITSPSFDPSPTLICLRRCIR